MEEQIEAHGGAETVGLVFVERRITALALHNYFLHRDREIEKGAWLLASQARKNVEQFFPSAQLNGSSAGQFDDAMDDPGFENEIPKPLTKSSMPNSISDHPINDGKEVSFDDQFMDAEDDDMPGISYGTAINPIDSGNLPDAIIEENKDRMDFRKSSGSGLAFAAVRN